MQLLSTLALLSSLALGIVAQGGPVKLEFPEPGQIVQPKDNSHFLFDDETIHLWYNYTEAAEKAPTVPTVNVFVRKSGESARVEVGKGLDCKNTFCENGILKYNFTLSHYHPLIGWGNYELLTIQDNYITLWVLGEPQTHTIKIPSGKIEFTVDLLFGQPLANASTALRMQGH